MTNKNKEKKGFDKVQDSGARREFNTGSVRDQSEGKGRFDLIPPYALWRLARHFENGAKKYNRRNWEKGQPLSTYLDCAERHLKKVIAGWNDEDHESAVAWNIFAFIETKKRIEEGILPKELDDMTEVWKTQIKKWDS